MPVHSATPDPNAKGIEKTLEEYQNWCRVTQTPTDISAAAILARTLSFLKYKVEQSRHVEGSRPVCLTWEELKALAQDLQVAIDPTNSIAELGLHLRRTCYELSCSYPVVVPKRTLNIDCSMNEDGDGPAVIRSRVRSADEDDFDAYANDRAFQEIEEENQKFDLGEWMDESDEEDTDEEGCYGDAMTEAEFKRNLRDLFERMGDGDTGGRSGGNADQSGGTKQASSGKGGRSASAAGKAGSAAKSQGGPLGRM